MITNNKTIASLSSRLGSVEDTVVAQHKELQHMRGDSKRLQSTIDQVLAVVSSGQPGQAAVPPPLPPACRRRHREDAAKDEFAAANSDEDDLDDYVSGTEHAKVISKLGISADRADGRGSFEEYGRVGGRVNGVKYWKQIMACKTTTQWKAKLKSLGVPDSEVDACQGGGDLKTLILKHYWDDFEDSDDEGKTKAGNPVKESPMKRQATGKTR